MGLCISKNKEIIEENVRLQYEIKMLKSQIKELQSTLEISQNDNKEMRASLELYGLSLCGYSVD